MLGGGHYARLARTNCVRLVREPAPRGMIYDREGAVLADNRPGFDIEIILEDIEDKDLLVKSLGEILGVGEETIRQRLKGHRTFSYLPVTIASDVSMDQVVAIEERQPGLAGVHVGVYPRRNYLYGKTVAHVIGYLGKISPGELERHEGRGYTGQDLIGKSGIEKQYEDFLAGRAGGEGIQVDSRGYLDKVLYRQEPEPGSNIYLNLDLRVQQAADSILGDTPGAVVALDPRNGAVLAMASSPSFDSNALVPPVDREIVRELFGNEKHPMINRPIRGLYPPGSIFKPIVALAGLGAGALNERTTFECRGVFTLGRHPYRCWNEKGHGQVSVVDGLMLSCNVFFYNAGLLTGRDAIVEMANEFGFMEKSGIDLPGELAGVTPTAEWCAAHGVGRWNRGDTVVIAIGQGYLLLTPLRAAMVMAAIASGGDIYRPRVAGRIVSPLGDTVERYEPELVRRIPLRKGDLALVREGLRRAVNSVFGTGQKAELEGIEVAGKTGTVQVGPEDARRNHSWFVGFAPFKNPEIVVAVLLEGKESGGFFAAPAARKIFEAYFNNKDE